MIGIYLICFIVFPLCILVQTKKSIRKNVILEREDTEIVKGIATCFVILAHLVISLKEGADINPILNIFTVTGGMGVLIFFFVSGYGIFKGYENKAFEENKASFLRKRIVSVYLPSVLVQLFFNIIALFWRTDFSIRGIIVNSLFGPWFVDVIMIQYFIFYFSWRLSGGGQNILINSSFLFSVIAAAVFYICGFNPRWYNGLLLFPIGMLIAWKEEKIIISMQRKWLMNLVSTSILFILSGGGIRIW